MEEYSSAEGEWRKHSASESRPRRSSDSEKAGEEGVGLWERSSMGLSCEQSA